MTIVKLCGNHSLSDLQEATKSKAQYIGVIFADSKRKVEPVKLKEWLVEVNMPETKELVGVFVNPTIQEIEHVFKYVQLDIIQLHGTETESFIRKVQDKFEKPIFKAIHHQPPKSMETMEKLSPYVEGFVVDSKIRGAWGGTGVKFDWESIPSYLALANRLQKQCFIAGGITPENVGECLSYGPEAIDLSSGIECNGRKDRRLIRSLEERMKDFEIRNA